MFATVSHFHPNLIIVGKAGAYPSGVLQVVIMHPYLMSICDIHVKHEISVINEAIRYKIL